MLNMIKSAMGMSSAYKIKPVLYPYSPDVARLETRESWLYFSYLPELDHHEGFITDAYTRDRYSLWKKDQGDKTFPIPISANSITKALPQLPIRGKLVLLSTPTIVKLDELAFNGERFLRKRVEIDYVDEVRMEVRDRDSADLMAGRPLKHHRPGGPSKHSEVSIPVIQTVKAWMHIGVSEHWMLPSSVKSRMMTKDGLEGRNLSAVFIRKSYDDEYLLSVTKRYRLTKSNPYYMYNHEAEVNERK